MSGVKASGEVNREPFLGHIEYGAASKRVCGGSTGFSKVLGTVLDRTCVRAAA